VCARRRTRTRQGTPMSARIRFTGGRRGCSPAKLTSGAAEGSPSSPELWRAICDKRRMPSVTSARTSKPNFGNESALDRATIPRQPPARPWIRPSCRPAGCCLARRPAHRSAPRRRPPVAAKRVLCHEYLAPRHRPCPDPGQDATVENLPRARALLHATQLPVSADGGVIGGSPSTTNTGRRKHDAGRRRRRATRPARTGRSGVYAYDTAGAPLWQDEFPAGRGCTGSGSPPTVRGGGGRVHVGHGAAGFPARAYDAATGRLMLEVATAQRVNQVAL
jgi:hypothetical protein